MKAKRLIEKLSNLNEAIIATADDVEKLLKKAVVRIKRQGDNFVLGNITQGVFQKIKSELDLKVYGGKGIVHGVTGNYLTSSDDGLGVYKGKELISFIFFEVNESLDEKLSPQHSKLLKAAAKELGKTEDEVLKMWNDDKPHFGGGMPHRYDAGSKECSYCLRPKDWEKQ